MPSWAIYGNERRRGMHAAPEFSAEVTQFLDRVATQSGPRQVAYAALIDGLVADGIWAKLDALYIFAAAESATALENLKQDNYHCTVNGSPTFAADDGYTGVAASTTVYLDTGFNPSTASGNYTLNSAHASVWCFEDHEGNGSEIAMGLSTTGFGAINVMMIPRFNTDDAHARINEAVSTVVTVANCAGHLLGSRTSSTAGEYYLNGTSLGTSNLATDALINGNVYILGNNTVGVGPEFGGAFKLSAASLGSGLNDTEASDFNDHLRTYMTAVGVP
jgi:hypothetical protein